MKAIRDIKRKIDQKNEEVQRLRRELAKTEAYVEAATEMLKMLEKETGSDSGGATIRAGSMVDKVRIVLRKEGKPLHIEELLRRIGREVTKANRASLAGSLGGYVRDCLIFTRPIPATFGLVEFDTDDTDELPATFGQ